eukprot:TRINITY_DN8582_c0_g1_i10.p1 TRINITY_DN8582_c0_g1~~TRINITY_DN8582_c0_g1_i10.p1  ORF type:complete len:1006 (+),score=244.96 TRINITY_DN8582_c0_g1_i10:333-3350(+)
MQMKEERDEDVVPAGPLSHRSRREGRRPPPAWEDLAASIGAPKKGALRSKTLVFSRPCSRATTASPSRGVRSPTPTGRVSPWQHRPASRVALARACCSEGNGSEASSWTGRGWGAIGSLRKQRLDKDELARHRVEVAGACAGWDRAQAMLYRRRQVEAERKYEAEFENSAAMQEDGSPARDFRSEAFGSAYSSERSPGHPELKEVHFAVVDEDDADTLDAAMFAEARSSLVPTEGAGNIFRNSAGVVTLGVPLPVDVGRDVSHDVIAEGDDECDDEESADEAPSGFRLSGGLDLNHLEEAPIYSDEDDEEDDESAEGSEEENQETGEEAEAQDEEDDFDDGSEDENEETGVQVQVVREDSLDAVNRCKSPSALSFRGKKKDSLLYIVNKHREKAEGVAGLTAQASAIAGCPRGLAASEAAVTKITETNGKLRRLLQARRVEFDQRPQDDRERLLKAFAAGSMAGRPQPLLETAGLKAALAELKLNGKVREEKAAVKELLREATAVCQGVNFFDFVYLLVPQVEQRLLELRSPELFVEFQEHCDANMRLRSADAIDCLEQLALSSRVADAETVKGFWYMYKRDFYKDVFLSQCDARGLETIAFKGFKFLVEDMNTRLKDYRDKFEQETAAKAHLTEVQVEAHFGELSFLHKKFSATHVSRFRAICKKSRGVTAKVNHGLPSTLAALINCGAVSPNGPSLDRAQAFLKRYTESTLFSFGEFLHLIERIRAEERLWLSHGIDSLRRKHQMQVVAQEQLRLGGITLKKDGESWAVPDKFTVNDVPHLIKHLQLCQDCPPSLDDVRAEMKAFTSAIDTDRMAIVLNKICERARSAARKWEAAVAKELQIEERDVSSLRAAFADLTTTGLVGLAEVRIFLQSACPDALLREEDIESMIDEVSSQDQIAKMRRRSYLNAMRRKQSEAAQRTGPDGDGEEISGSGSPGSFDKALQVGRRPQDGLFHAQASEDKPPGANVQYSDASGRGDGGEILLRFDGFLRIAEFIVSAGAR